MAIVAGRGVSTGRAQADVTSGRNDADVSQREDLANFITMITREETPFISSIGKAKATAIYHEWQTDELQAPGNSRLAGRLRLCRARGYRCGRLCCGSTLRRSTSYSSR